MSKAENLWAALDLGSNSFHLLLVEQQAGRWRIVETLKEKVQLLGGFSDGRIHPDALQRGLNCVTRFAQRLRSVPAAHICAMGTHALRSATNTQPFITHLANELGINVQVISGEREAELIFKAVSVGSVARAEQQIVVDIGGGSTEICLGRAGTIQTALSLDMGCVAFKEKYFQTSQASGFAAARDAATHALEQAPEAMALKGLQDVDVVGTSGTIESVQTVLRANGWDWEEISAQGMARLDAAISDERWIVAAGLPGLAPDRVDIFPAGVAILKACFDVLGLASMRFVDLTLLHGMIFNTMNGSETDNDPAAQPGPGPGALPTHPADLATASITELARRFEVEQGQAARVNRTALSMFDQVAQWWPEPDRQRRWLGWAAIIHELGMHVSARHYHRHGAYVLRHADLPGVETQERHVLALLVRGHRRNLPGLALQSFAPELSEQLIKTLAILRLAVILERSHRDQDSPAVKVRLEQASLLLTLPEGWLDQHPLSARELEVETRQLANAGITLRVA